MSLPHIPNFTPVRPVILITGFLGAGKTTLLRQLLIAAQNKKLHTDVILNDYADANVDSATLEEFTQSIEPLTATCACCEGLDFLIDLSHRTSNSESDILFVELNGTADPVPVIESFTLLENKLQLHPRWQVCVIDTRSFGNRGSYSDIEELQLQTASHIYLSHTNKDESPQEIVKQIKEVNSYATIIEDIQEFSMMVTALAAKKQTRLLDSRPEIATNDVNLVKKSDKHALTHEFTACQILMPESAPEDTIKNWMNALPDDVLRVKLLIGLAEQPGTRYLLERVDSEVSPYRQKVRLGNNVPNSAILIGPDLKIKELEELTLGFFQPHS